MINFIYPLLYALIPVFVFYNKNIGEVRSKDFVKLVFYCIIIYSLTYFVLYKALLLINQNLQLTIHSITGAVIFYMLILFYTPWYKINRFKSRYAYQYFIKYILYLVLVCSIAYFNSVLPIILTVVLSLILLLNLVYLTQNYTSKNNLSHINNRTEMKAERDKPDVYHIILDSYIGNKGLLDIAKYDNTSFENQLKKLGFKIVDNIYSNYNHTAASIPSMMNMGYTNDYLNENEKNTEMYRKESQQYRFMRIIRSKTVEMLKSIGYKISVNGSTIFTEKILDLCSDIIDISDIQNNTAFKNFVIINFLKMTILSSLYMKKVNNTGHAKYLINAFEHIYSDYGIQSPYYYFNHILAPHPPYCFDHEGNINNKYADMIEFPEFSMDTVNAYIEHMRYINVLTLNSMEKLIAKIKAKNNKAIILVHGDHGALLQEASLARYNIFFAYYTYGYDNQEIFPNNITLVNIFPILFNKIFKTSIPIHKDYFYYETLKDFTSEWVETDCTDKLIDYLHGE